MFTDLVCARNLNGAVQIKFDIECSLMEAERNYNLSYFN